MVKKEHIKIKDCIYTESQWLQNELLLFLLFSWVLLFFVEFLKKSKLYELLVDRKLGAVCKNSHSGIG